MFRHCRILLTCAGVSLLFGCDGKGKQDPAKQAEAAEKTKDNDPEEAESDAPKELKVDEKKAEDYFSLEHDKSGILARTAGVLETEEKLDSEALRELSHHAEKLPSVEEICKHEKDVDATIDTDVCVTDLEHHIVRIGPELYKDWADCLNDASSVEAIKACNDAEAAVERDLHVKKPGDGLDEDTCEGLFQQFEKLSVADAGEDGELVKEILEEVKPDVLTACADQGTQSEVDCAMKAEDMSALKDCGSSMI